MDFKLFGDAGDTVIIEDYLEGEEASILVISDGNDFVCLAPSQDHKRALDEDRGPNTGGMGAYSPTPLVSDEMLKEIKEKIIAPIIKGLAKDGKYYNPATGEDITGSFKKNISEPGGKLPPEIGQLTNLNVLNLAGNQLRTLPPEIGELTNLTDLCLAENQLCTLPPEIGQFAMGAINVYKRIVGDYLLVAMGDVPPTTLKQLADGIESKRK